MAYLYSVVWINILYLCIRIPEISNETLARKPASKTLSSTYKTDFLKSLHQCESSFCLYFSYLRSKNNLVYLLKVHVP